jgi:hypothetical protein
MRGTETTLNSLINVDARLAIFEKIKSTILSIFHVINEKFYSA